MTRQELSALIDNWINIEWLEKEIIQKSELYNMLIEIALYGNEPKSWRAAYIADRINDSNPNLLIPYLLPMIDQLKVETNASKKRHFLKLISQNKIPENYFGFLFNYCLQHLTSAKEPVAVRVHAMQNLYNMAQIYPDLRNEVISAIEHEMEYHSSAGIKSRGKKLVEKLKQ
ncbi:MAG: hypothetical protein JXR61_05065 [Prolixibacteraceae bacterium]|nr:hypothetical protein [Prolixibacteraceae bacterium]